MKSLVVYLVALVVGSGVGAFGMGAYNVMVVGVEMPSDSLAVVDSTATGEGEEDGGEQLEVDPVQVAEGGEETGEGSEDPEPTDGGEAVADGGSDSGSDGSAGDLTEAGAGGGASGASAGADPVAVAQVPPPDPDSLARAQQNYQRLARIFAAMKPDEAAPVLSQLNDAQLEGILLAMQGRNAAPILAAMDPERAASISRRVLGGS